MEDNIYTRLREFLDTLPTGFPETPTSVELKILKRLFSPEQAELTMQLKQDPEEVPSIAERIKMDASELAQKLEEMAQKGLIFRTRDRDKVLYQAFQFIIGIYEFQVNHLDKEFCELFEEYLPYFGMSLAGVKTKQLRVVPVESALKVKPKVATYNSIRDLVREQDNIAVTECICAKEQGILGNECYKPLETCIAFGDFAQYYIDNKMGRKISADETFQLLDRAEEIGLVLQPTNTQKIAAVCCCCSCCCPYLRFSKMSDRPAEFFISYYQSTINSDLCTACGECIDRCPMAAIAEGETVTEIKEEYCIGCGLCVSICPDEAISLTEKPNMDAPQMTITDTFNKIKTERVVLSSGK